MHLPESLFPAVRLGDYDMFPGDELMYISNGMDSVVYRWRNSGTADTVLKYYKSLTQEMLTAYAHALKETALLSIPPIHSSLGRIPIEVVQIQHIGSVPSDETVIAISQSPYISGIELRACDYSQEEIERCFEHLLVDVTPKGHEHISLFSKVYKDKHNPLKNDIHTRIHELNQTLEKHFGTNFVRCSPINIKVHGNQEGITCYITDITPCVNPFVTHLLQHFKK